MSENGIRVLDENSSLEDLEKYILEPFLENYEDSGYIDENGDYILSDDSYDNDYDW